MTPTEFQKLKSCQIILDTKRNKCYEIIRINKKSRKSPQPYLVKSLRVRCKKDGYRTSITLEECADFEVCDYKVWSLLYA